MKGNARIWDADVYKGVCFKRSKGKKYIKRFNEKIDYKGPDYKLADVNKKAD